MTIYFYTKNDDYGDFSNFSSHGIEMDGVWWKTVEHYFQAQKFEISPQREKIRESHTAKQAAELGRSRKVPIRPDWEVVKDSIMEEAVLKKFQTHEGLRDLLLSTGASDIVENAPADYYWGAGKDGTGLNKLGKILVKFRTQLSV